MSAKQFVWLLTSSSWLLGHVVCLGKSCAPPRRFRKKIVDQKFVPQKITQLISRHLIQKTGYEAGPGIARLLSKASNTGSSRHIKIGCHLPVCITKRVPTHFGANRCTFEKFPPSPPYWHFNAETFAFLGYHLPWPIYKNLVETGRLKGLRASGI